jgi:aspartyl protease family protein
MSRQTIVIVALIALALLVTWLASSGTATSSDDYLRLIATGTVLIAVLSSVIMNWQGNLSDAARYGLIWVGLFFMIILGYSYRAEVNGAWQRVTGELSPTTPITRSGGEVVLRRASDGHFYADVALNGATVRMLADTGATTIALTESDAARAGIDIAKLDYIFVVQTANGEAPAAEVTLREVRVGSIVRTNVRASVGKNLGSSLLGMNFFNTLSKVSIESNELLLRD